MDPFGNMMHVFTNASPIVIGAIAFNLADQLKRRMCGMECRGLKPQHPCWLGAHAATKNSLLLNALNVPLIFRVFIALDQSKTSH